MNEDLPLPLHSSSMNSFEELSIKKTLLNAISDLDFEKPTPIQKEAYPKILSGKNVVVIVQT